VSSGDSGITEELNRLEEIERLKREVSHWRNTVTAEKTERDRLRSRLTAENDQLRQELKDERSKVERLQERVKDYETENLRASEYQAAAARTRHGISAEMNVKDEKIKELEARCQALEEDNRKYHDYAEKLREESKEAQVQIRYTQLQEEIDKLEKHIEELKTTRSQVRKQLEKAEDDRESLRSGSGGGSRNKSKTTRDVEALVERLDKENQNIRDVIKKAEHQLVKLRTEFERMPNPADLAGDLGPHSRSGSYDNQYETEPDLIADMSSLASGSPPQSDTLDPMDTFIMDRAIQIRQSNGDPWAKSVELPKGLSPRASDPFAVPTGKQKRNPYR
jgi:chromosome segregation ATPase